MVIYKHISISNKTSNKIIAGMLLLDTFGERNLFVVYLVKKIAGNSEIQKPPCCMNSVLAIILYNCYIKRLSIEPFVTPLY